MIDKNTFLETLREVAEIAKTSETPLEKADIQKYFSHMELSAEQEEMVYQYLQLPEELRTAQPEGDVSDETMAEEQEKPKIVEETAEVSIEKLSESAHYRMYLEEVKAKKALPQEDLKGFYEKLTAGDSSVTEQIVNSWLERILEIAKTYQKNAVHIEDIIQEGNMGLWMAIGSVTPQMKAEDVDKYLQEAVTNAMEDYVHEMTGVVDRTQAVLAKAALLHEAQELLVKENGQTPSLRQLSEYTHIPEEEIQDIFSLYQKEQA